MEHPSVNNDSPDDDLGLNPGELVMHHAGALDDATHSLDVTAACGSIDPDAVGKWVTAIGKAILAIFKP